MIYVYLDETTFGDESNYSGYGCLITESLIESSVITEALENLESDPDRLKLAHAPKDNRTLSRGFFHAADDSQNAHSHLCRSINSNISGIFKSHVLHQKTSFFNMEEAYDLSSKLAILEIFWMDQEVKFIFEHRNSLTDSRIRTWWKMLWEELSHNAYNRPFYTTYYPKLNYEIKSKHDPGLQVVDFLLWATSRKTLGKNCKWLDRVKSVFTTKTSPEDGSWGGYSLNINYLRRNTFNYGYDDYIHSTEEIESDEGVFAKYIVNAQKVINHLYVIGANNQTEHFWADIKFLAENRLTDYSVEYTVLLAKTFVKSFDNIRLLELNTPIELKSFWLHCRKYFALLLYPDSFETRVNRCRINDIRTSLIRHHPELLEISE